jgi:hypothetical protein
MFTCRIFTTATTTEGRVSVSAWAETCRRERKRVGVSACRRVSIFPSTAAIRNKKGEAFHEGGKSPPRFLVDHFALAVEHLVGV